MFRQRTVQVLFATALLVGCVRSATGERPTPAMLSDTLVTVTDMPGDWSETQRQVFQERGPENPSVDPSVWCPESDMVTGNLVELAGPSGADVEMQSSPAGGASRMMRLQAWANADVEAYYRDAKEAARICDGTTTTEESGAVTTFTVIDGRDIGDESVSWSQRTTPPPATQGEKMESIGRTTIARFGGIIMVLQMGDAAPTGSAALIDESQWWDIVTLAGKKLDTLDEQVHP